MKAAFIIAGMVVGLIVVRGFAFNPIEEIGWHIFREVLFSGRFSTGDIGEVLKSTTFGKFALGIEVGGLAGYIAALKLAPLKNAVEKAKQSPRE